MNPDSGTSKEHEDRLEDIRCSILHDIIVHDGQSDDDADWALDFEDLPWPVLGSLMPPPPESKKVVMIHRSVQWYGTDTHTSQPSTAAPVTVIAHQHHRQKLPSIFLGAAQIIGNRHLRRRSEPKENKAGRKEIDRGRKLVWPNMSCSATYPLGRSKPDEGNATKNGPADLYRFCVKIVTKKGAPQMQCMHAHRPSPTQRSYVDDRMLRNTSCNSPIRLILSLRSIRPTHLCGRDNRALKRSCPSSRSRSQCSYIRVLRIVWD